MRCDSLCGLSTCPEQQAMAIGSLLCPSYLIRGNRVGKEPLGKCGTHPARQVDVFPLPAGQGCLCFSILHKHCQYFDRLGVLAHPKQNGAANKVAGSYLIRRPACISSHSPLKPHFIPVCQANKPEFLPPTLMLRLTPRQNKWDGMTCAASYLIHQFDLTGPDLHRQSYDRINAS